MSKESVDLEPKLMKAAKVLFLISIILNIATDLYFTSSIDFSDIALPSVMYLALIFTEKKSKE